MPTTTSCFSCPDPVPPGLRRMPTGTSCFRYQAEAPRSMPFMCFSYPSAGLPRTGSRSTVPPDLPGLRRMPGSTSCFRY